ncbi:MAG: S1C family serine protease [Pyrinomonadaceae bacterium]
MKPQSVYQLSARQILLLAFSSALIAVGATALIYNYGKLTTTGAETSVNLAESAPLQGISDPSTVSDEQNSIDVYKTVSPGVAFITTTMVRRSWMGDQEGEGSGSGSVIDNQGHILTNYHVIEGAQKLTVSFGGEKTYTATLVGGDPDTDLAVIKLDSVPPGLPSVPLGDSEKLVVGQKVLAIGNPFGLDRTLTTGVISGLQRPIRSRRTSTSPSRPIDAAIQTDASINPGNSGGPLLDKFGRMIGINSQILSPSGASVGVGFAVPVNTAKRVIPQLIQFGEVRRPKFGATLPSVADLSSRIELPVASGLLVYQTQPGGAAERAGIRGVQADGSIGDIILSAEGQKLNNLDDLYRLLDRKQIGDTVNFEVYRSGRTVTVPVRLIAAPQTRRVNE